MDSLISEKMAEDLTLPDFVACGEYMEMLKMIAIFFNSGWSRSDIHFDVSETIFAQVTGGRQWLLTTPTDGKYLYSDEFPYHSGTSPVNWEAIDLVKYPDVSKIAIYNATLDVGDVIYVPEGWWHQAKVTGGIPNIAIAVFIDFLHCLKNAPPSNDSVFIDNCIKLREDKPREMKCNMPLNGMTVKEVYDNYSHLKPQAMKFTIPEFRKDIFEYQPLKSGYSMPTLGLGLGGMSPEEANRSIRHAMRHGYRFFDTDSEDETEATLGYIMGDNPYCKREDVFVIAKVHPKNLGRNATKSSVERSMKRLNTDYIDLILIKAPSCDKEMIDCKAAENPGTWQESWQALEDMSKAGSIRSLGVSNFNILQMEELLTMTTVPVSALQARFDLMKRNTKLREFCNKNGIRFIAHSLLGFKWAKSSSKTNPILHSQMVGFAARFYRTGPASVLIRYALEKNITVVPKSSNRLHIVLNKNSLIMNLRESKDALDALDNFPHIP
ncbi:uncharacterized protein LOC106171369 isoform X2 [Lingula anatina]|nr:uncharacterized protein LOC106171369 isoform X2 [Lingula anatina]|eukprot:XP_013407137.1 uncharacterized protein LOC106171369 isoform X2 [Lingula anatina]